MFYTERVGFFLLVVLLEKIKPGQILPANVGDPAHMLGRALSVYKHINAPESSPSSSPPSPSGYESTENTSSAGDSQTEYTDSQSASTHSTADVKPSSTADLAAGEEFAVNPSAPRKIEFEKLSRDFI